METRKKGGWCCPSTKARAAREWEWVGVALLTAVVAVWSALRFGRCYSLLVQTFYFGQFPSVPPITARVFNYHIIPCMYNYYFPISDPLHITPGSRHICLFSVVPSRLSHGFFMRGGRRGDHRGSHVLRMCRCAYMSDIFLS